MRTAAAKRAASTAWGVGVGVGVVLCECEAVGGSRVGERIVADRRAGAGGGAGSRGRALSVQAAMRSGGQGEGGLGASSGGVGEEVAAAAQLGDVVDVGAAAWWSGYDVRSATTGWAARTSSGHQWPPAGDGGESGPGGAGYTNTTMGPATL